MCLARKISDEPSRLDYGCTDPDKRISSVKLLTTKALCLVAAFSCLLPCLRADESKSLVLGGDRIGQVNLRMHAAEVERVLGEPSSGDQNMNLRQIETWLAKSPDGKTQVTQTWEIHVNYGQDNRKPTYWQVIQVAVTSPFFRTHAGNSTQSSLAAIWREYPDLHYLDQTIGGEGSNLEVYDSAPLGIAFLIERNKSAEKGEPWGKCRAIIVHPAGQGPNTTALEFMVKPPPPGS